MKLRCKLSILPPDYSYAKLCEPHITITRHLLKLIVTYQCTKGNAPVSWNMNVQRLIDLAFRVRPRTFNKIRREFARTMHFHDAGRLYHRMHPREATCHIDHYIKTQEGTRGASAKRKYSKSGATRLAISVLILLRVRSITQNSSVHRIRENNKYFMKYSTLRINQIITI